MSVSFIYASCTYTRRISADGPAQPGVGVLSFRFGFWVPNPGRNVMEHAGDFYRLQTHNGGLNAATFLAVHHGHRVAEHQCISYTECVVIQCNILKKLILMARLKLRQCLSVQQWRSGSVPAWGTRDCALR